VRHLHIVEQTLPGDAPESEDQAERKGLPDIVIHDDAGWCLLIESKVQAALTKDQLARHERTLRRRGIRDIQRVVLTKVDARAPRALSLTWSGLYQWLGTSDARGEWAERLRS
jgi:PD-(D/E)XK nuclease superfamily